MWEVPPDCGMNGERTGKDGGAATPGGSCDESEDTPPAPRERGG
jgi:hypothetical protein